MMKFWLDASGLFYHNGRIVSLVRKAEPVARYLIYHTIDDQKPLPICGSIYHFHEGEYLVVEMKENYNRDDWGKIDRRFFQMVDGAFVERTFKPVEILEGELELAHHLGLEDKIEYH